MVVVSDVVRLASPVDVIGAVPVLLGFEPELSCSVLVFDGSQGLVVTARVDLVDLADPGCAEQLAGLVARYGVFAVAVVHGEDVAGGAAAVGVLVEAGMPVREGLVVVGDRWWSVDPVSGAVERGGVVPGVPSAAVVEMRVASGVVPEVSRAVVAGRVDPPAVGCWEGLVAAYAAAERRVELLSLGERVEVVRGFVAAYGGPDAALPDPGAVATVVVLVNGDVRVRDAAWSLLDRGSAAGQARLWGHVVRVSHPDWASTVLGLFGWASWVAGDGVSVNVALEALERGDGLSSWSGLLGELVSRAVPPSWWEVVVGPARLAVAAELAVDDSGDSTV